MRALAGFWGSKVLRDANEVLARWPHAGAASRRAPRHFCPCTLAVSHGTKPFGLGGRNPPRTLRALLGRAVLCVLQVCAVDGCLHLPHRGPCSGVRGTADALLHRVPAHGVFDADETPTRNMHGSTTAPPRHAAASLFGPLGAHSSGGHRPQNSKACQRVLERGRRMSLFACSWAGASVPPWRAHGARPCMGTNRRAPLHFPRGAHAGAAARPRRRIGAPPCHSVTERTRLSSARLVCTCRPRAWLCIAPRVCNPCVFHQH